MNVSKINVLNVNKSGVSSFSGDTSDSINKKSAGMETSQKVLYGAGIVSAGILAVALAGRAGLFDKFLSKASSEVAENLSDKGFKLKDEIVTQIPAKFNIVKGDDVSRAERLARKTPSDEELASIIDYAKYDTYKTPERKAKFLAGLKGSFANMSYEEQFEQFPPLLNFLKKQGLADRTLPVDPLRLKRDNDVRLLVTMKDFATENPDFQPMLSSMVDKTVYSFGKFSKYDEEVQKLVRPVLFPKKGEYMGSKMAVFFTNSAREIERMDYNSQVPAFRKYLDFIKTIEPEQLKNEILFTTGKFDWDNNFKIASEAVNFAKENPAYSDVIVRNLIAYETGNPFARDLAYANFERVGNLVDKYDNHIDNIIRIRKLLTESGLKCDDVARARIRRDWVAVDNSTENSYMMGFQYAQRLPEVRRVAMEYDLSQGLTADEAKVLCERITAKHNTCGKTKTEKLFDMKLEDVIAKINSAVVA